MKLSRCVALLVFLILFYLIGPIYFFSHIRLPVVSEVLLTSNIYRFDVNSPVWLFHEPPLHEATRQEQSGLVAELIKFGADPNQPSGEYGHRPLHIASMQCSAPIVNLLIEAGAKVSLPSCKVDASVDPSAVPTVSQLESHLHSTPLHLVAAKAPEGCNFTALISAMFSDLQDMVEPSIPNIHEVDHLGNTFMHQAAMHCNLPFLTWLLQDVTSQYPSLSDLFSANPSSSSASPSPSSILVDFKQAALAQLWQKNKFGWLPIHYASICEVSSQKKSTGLKKGKIFTMLQNYKNQMAGTLEMILLGGEVSPPPTYANLSGSDLRALMLNQETEDGQTPFLLFAASRYQNGELVGFYAKNGANLSHVDHKGRNVFHAAGFYRNKELIDGMWATQNALSQKLLRAEDVRMWTPLDAAIYGGDSALVQSLILKIGESHLVAHVDYQGWTGLHIAAYTGDREVIALLLQHHASIESRTGKGQLPFDLLPAFPSIQVQNLLLPNGQHTNAPDMFSGCWPVVTWNKDQVRDNWLKAQSPRVKQAMEAFDTLAGPALCELTDQKLLQAGVKDFELRKEIMLSIRPLAAAARRAHGHSKLS